MYISCSVTRLTLFAACTPQRASCSAQWPEGVLTFISMCVASPRDHFGYTSRHYHLLTHSGTSFSIRSPLILGCIVHSKRRTHHLMSLTECLSGRQASASAAMVSTLEKQLEEQRAGAAKQASLVESLQVALSKERELNFSLQVRLDCAR